MVRTIFKFIFIQLILALRIWAEDSTASGHFVLAKIDSELVDLFTTSLDKNTLLQSPFVYREESTEPETTSVWRGNVPTIEADITKAQLILEGPQNKDGSAQRFNIELNFNKDNLVIRSDKPKSRIMLGGAKINFRGQYPKRHFLEGRDETSFVLAFPKFKDENLMGVLICPRKLSREKIKRADGSAIFKDVLVDTDYKIAASSFAIEAHIKSKVLTGLAPGNAKASIKTTANISKATVSSDEVFSKDAEVNMTYRADVHDTIIPAQGTDEQAGGMLIEIDLHKPAGYRRVWSYQHAMWFKQIQLKNSFDVGVDRILRPVMPGSCILALEEKTTLVHYSKEPLKSTKATQLGRPL